MLLPDVCEQMGMLSYKEQANEALCSCWEHKAVGGAQGSQYRHMEETDCMWGYTDKMQATGWERPKK